jgi:hypothetical protein
MKIVGKIGRRVRAAFTLVEVLLAVGIIAGLLMVVLYFYQQAAELRTELLLDAERSSARDWSWSIDDGAARGANAYILRSALVGDATYLQFITTDLPSQTAWTGERLWAVSPGRRAT